MTIRLVTAMPEVRWEAALVAAFDAQEHGITVARRTVDAVELQSVVAAGLADVVLASGALPHLDAAVVAQLQATGAAVVLAGAGHGDSGPGTQLGENRTVDYDSDPTLVAEAVRSAVVSARASHVMRTSESAQPRPGLPTNEEGSPGADGTVAEVLASSAETVCSTGGPDESDGPPVPVVVAVWGPAGAPGRTTVAVTLAEVLARRGVATTLVDADPYGGCVAQTLGVMDEGSGLLEACRDAASGRLDRHSLMRQTRVLPSGLRLLSGFSRADRWPEASAPLVSRVLAQCRGVSVVTVVDVGFCLEEDEVLSYDTAAPQRNGATLAAVRSADLLLAVCGTGPVAVARFIRGLEELRATTRTPPKVVLNGSESASGAEGNDPAAVLERFARVRVAAHLPYDRQTVLRAVAEGRSVPEVAPRSRLCAAVATLAGEVLVEDDVENTRATRGRRRMLRVRRSARNTVAG